MNSRNDHSSHDQANRGLMWLVCALRNIFDLVTLPRMPTSNTKSEYRSYRDRSAEAFGMRQFMASPLYILIILGSVVALAPGLGIDFLLVLLVSLTFVFLFYVLYTDAVSHIPSKPVVVREYNPAVGPSRIPFSTEVEIRPPKFLA